MQQKSDDYREFDRRLSALIERVGTLAVVSDLMGVSRETLNVSRKGLRPITAKTWAALMRVEGKNLTQTENQKSDALNEDQAHYGAHSPQFSAYVAFISQCRSEAMRLAGGDPDKAAPIFDRILEVWHQSQRPHAPATPPLPFPQSSPCIQKKTTA